MSTVVDITGQRFGQWTVVEYAGKSKHNHRRWRCRCSCGREFVRCEQTLVAGSSTQCVNCANRKKGAAGVKHGQSRVGKWTYMYRRWASMKRVCFNPASKEYKYYGGRGISMHPAWVDSFEKFEADVVSEIGHRPGSSATLDRIDNNGDYQPGNIRWATMREQCRNRRTTRMVTFREKTMSLIEWAEELDMEYGTLNSRTQRGWTVERILTTPAGPYKKKARK